MRHVAGTAGVDQWHVGGVIRGSDGEERDRLRLEAIRDPNHEASPREQQQQRDGRIVDDLNRHNNMRRVRREIYPGKAAGEQHLAVVLQLLFRALKPKANTTHRRTQQIK